MKKRITYNGLIATILIFGGMENHLFAMHRVCCCLNKARYTFIRKIEIFDTTLRDGQQSPKAAMSHAKNREYMRLATKIGFDIIEVGFPAASNAEFNRVKEIVQLYSNCPSSPKIAALCQLRIDQIEKTALALQYGISNNKSRIHIYVPVDPNLIQASFGNRDKTQIIRDVYFFVKKASQMGLEVQFSLEGYSRQGENFDFSTDVIRAAYEAGATIINCPDTIGGACRREKNYFVKQMNRHAKIIDREYPNNNIIWSAHCHNDRGLATENTMCAVYDGPARQIEGCINGIGERAGNAALEQCIMYLKHIAPKKPSDPFYTGVDTRQLGAISDFVHENMLPRQPHSPITGENASTHSSGGHTNAILNNVTAYQPFHPEEVGKKVKLIFGHSSGGSHAREIIKSTGIDCSHRDKAHFARFAQFVKNKYQNQIKFISDEQVVAAYPEFCDLEDQIESNSDEQMVSADPEFCDPDFYDPENQ